MPKPGSSASASETASAPAATVLAFNPGNQLAVRLAGRRLSLAFDGPSLAATISRLDLVFPRHTPVTEYFQFEHDGLVRHVCFTQVEGDPADDRIGFRSIEQLQAGRALLEPALAAVLDRLDPYLIEIPYLHLGENDFIYKFRVEKDRNRGIYQIDATASALYQSRLCEAVKALTRQHERTATRPAVLDFGAVRYVIPSHFGFCLGVKNAIERAYETLAENPGRRVFMLSELIHNPFVNEDLLRRGLRYLQTDKGAPYTASGRTATEVPSDLSAMASATVEAPAKEVRMPASPAPFAKASEARLLWDTLTPDDIVIIPAFGATDDDKRRLIRKGIRVAQYDATCMLVEKVWKAACAFGREGYTVIIHGKSEHEETKATFSNTRRHAPSVIIRNLAEARVIGDFISAPSPARRAAFDLKFAAVCTPGFDPARQLERLAVVNQTTLLMNETIEIIEYFKGVYHRKYGAAGAAVRVGGGGRRDTLCYATQVNQDALSRALAGPLDAAFVIGGKNSSNTYQLYRLCEQRLGPRAFSIQSEGNIRSREVVEHYVFPSHGPGTGGGHVESRPFPEGGAPLRVLLTGGASCPDGIIQQVITRINTLFPAERLRSIEAVLADLQAESAKTPPG